MKGFFASPLLTFAAFAAEHISVLYVVLHCHVQLFNHVLTTAPSWNDKSYRVDMVGTPFNAILDWLMGTLSLRYHFLRSGK